MHSTVNIHLHCSFPPCQLYWYLGANLSHLFSSSCLFSGLLAGYGHIRATTWLPWLYRELYSVKTSQSSIGVEVDDGGVQFIDLRCSEWGRRDILLLEALPERLNQKRNIIPPAPLVPSSFTLLLRVFTLRNDVAIICQCHQSIYFFLLEHIFKWGTAKSSLLR